MLDVEYPIEAGVEFIVFQVDATEMKSHIDLFLNSTRLSNGD